jgi:hypothetical protein
MKVRIRENSAMLPPKERKILIICASLVVASLIVLVVVLGIRHRHQTELSKTTPTPEPSVAARFSSHPDFEGIEALTEHGLTSYQVQNVEYSFNQYKEKSGSVKKVWVDANTLTSVDVPREQTTKTIAFGGKFNDQTIYRAKVDFYDLTVTRLYLYDDKDKLLYDSGKVDLYNAQ